MMRPTNVVSRASTAFRRANLALYRTFLQPFVRAASIRSAADLMRKLHPLRLQYEAFSNANPLMAPIAVLAEQVRNNRKPAADDNPFIAMQENFSQPDRRRTRWLARRVEALAERTFMAVYGSPALQAGVGVDPAFHAAAAQRQPKVNCIANSSRDASPS